MKFLFQEIGFCFFELEIQLKFLKKHDGMFTWRSVQVTWQSVTFPFNFLVELLTIISNAYLFQLKMYNNFSSLQSKIYQFCLWNWTFYISISTSPLYNRRIFLMQQTQMRRFEFPLHVQTNFLGDATLLNWGWFFLIKLYASFSRL